MPHSTSRALRRALVLLAVGGVPAIFALACSQSTSHPPISGDCVGELCPPAQGRHTGGGGSDATTTGETGTPDGGAEAAGPDEAGNFPDVNVFPDVGID